MTTVAILSLCLVFTVAIYSHVRAVRASRTQAYRDGYEAALDDVMDDVIGALGEECANEVALYGIARMDARAKVVN